MGIQGLYNVGGPAFQPGAEATTGAVFATAIGANQVPYGDGTGKLTSSSSLTYNGTLLTFADAKNIVFGTVTGTKIGTSALQKLGFFNATPIVQPGATTDLRTALINLGLYASGGASPLDLNGGALTAATVAVSGAITSTLATGTAPFTVASTTVVGNLNVSQLLGATWTAPGTIGSGTPSTGAFTTLTASTSLGVTSGNVTLSNGIISQAIQDASTASATTCITLNHTSSGTPAIGHGAGILFNAADDSGVNTNQAQITSLWTTVTSATRTSTLRLYTVTSAGALAIVMDIGAGFVSCRTGFPLRAQDTTDATSGSAAAIQTPGGVGAAKAGWFGGILTANGATAAGTQPTFLAAGTSTIVGGVTDAYTNAIRLTPTYSAATALTVTRHNYIDLNQPAVAGVGPAAVTDAAVFRFNAAAGTHKAVDAGTTKTTPGTVDAWIKVNVNGTIYYMPAYTSKTT